MANADPERVKFHPGADAGDPKLAPELQFGAPANPKENATIEQALGAEGGGGHPPPITCAIAGVIIKNAIAINLAMIRLFIGLIPRALILNCVGCSGRDQTHRKHSGNSAIARLRDNSR